MSNPISKITSIPSATSAAKTAEQAPELEIDGPIDPSSAAPKLEVDPKDAAAKTSGKPASVSGGASVGKTEKAPTPKKGRSGMGLLALLLGLLLAGSVAFNLKQSREIATLADTTEQFEMALTAAVDRIDVETVRAANAEARLGGIGGAVDTVNERVASLLEALAVLSEATAK